MYVCLNLKPVFEGRRPVIRGVSWGGFGGHCPPGSLKGRKEKKKKETERREKRKKKGKERGKERRGQKEEKIER